MATRTIANGGGNWNTAGTWVEGAVPTSADAVVATATSGNLTVDITNAICLTFIMTGYVGTLTISGSNKLTVNSTITFVAGMSVTGDGNLTIGNTTATLTSGGLTIPFYVTFAGGTKALEDNWTINNSAIATASTTLTSNTLYISGGLTVNTGCSFGNSSNTIVMNGTGTIVTINTGSINSVIVFNTAGTITIGALLRIAQGITYTAGTIDASTNSSQLVLLQYQATINTNGITWYDVDWGDSSSRTLPLGSALTCSNELSLRCTTASDRILTFSGAYNITCGTLSLEGGITVKIPAGRTITAQNSIIAISDQSYGTISLLSVTPSSAINLVYSGTAENMNIAGCIFTDVDASGSSVPIFNWCGGALTRTTNIYNIDASDFPAVADVKDTVVYAGGAYEGTYAGTYAGGGSISDVFGMVG